jgi:uncharacterized Zn-finger protein
MMIFFNIIMTSLLPFLMGVFEKDVSEEVIERVSSTIQCMGGGGKYDFFHPYVSHVMI